ncbi:MAG: glutamate dehydrogenase 2 [Chlamydiota bacterium]|jgi:glutamate dehydrogenase
MPEHARLTQKELELATQKESELFRTYYSWIEEHMPLGFFEQTDTESVLAIVHALMGFEKSDYFSHIHLKDRAFVLSLDSPDADLKVLRHYRDFGIKNYRCFVSNTPPPFPKAHSPLRISRIVFTHAVDTTSSCPLLLKDQELLAHVQKRNPHVTDQDIKQLLGQLSPLFIQSITQERLSIALDLFFRAKSRDNCQYEVKRNEDWAVKQKPSLQVVLAWRNVPKYNFLYRLASIVFRHGLIIRRVNATYVDPYGPQNTLILSIGLHGMKEGAAWEEADLSDFLRELVSLKYFEEMESIETAFVDTKLLTGNQANLLKAMICFAHQALVAIDPHIYTLVSVEEAITRHPELSIKLIQGFEAKFHPQKVNLVRYEEIKSKFVELVKNIDTGNPGNDKQRKEVLSCALLMVDSILKTNYYRKNKTALSFRLKPSYLDALPFHRKEKFPEIPFGIFFIKGFYFTGFHIRFRDLARGGLRTVIAKSEELAISERNNLFSECYNLALTQNKKNKDIPEGGSKAVIFLEPYPHLQKEEEIYKKELEELGLSSEEVQKKIALIHKEQSLEYLYQAQRSYIESLLVLVNCTDNGDLFAKDIVDYWKKPEYIYLGPDENMHNIMLEWIAAFSKHYGYKPGTAFISSKPGTGINHKEFGVTSLGVNVYVEEVLKFLGIDPKKDPFFIKMSGGPDGDVAGNEMANLYKFYRNTAHLVATIDISGTIYDPEGLDLTEVYHLFEKGKPLRFYPPNKLHNGGFLLDVKEKKEESAYVQKTRCYKKENGQLIEEWISGNEMHTLLRHNVHAAKADIFVPGGGRPRTLNADNVQEFLDPEGKPTARAIVEGANLYLTPEARLFLEEKGTLIIKDSSANKGGVICSSFEVLAGLVLSEEEFLKEKKILVEQILSLIQDKARQEARLLLKSYEETGLPLTTLSDKVSERINLYKDELLSYLQPLTLSSDPKDPLICCLLNHAPLLLRTRYADRLLTRIPDVHKKAIIACHIASRIVYLRGLSWEPSLVDVLPLITKDSQIIGNQTDTK